MRRLAKEALLGSGLLRVAARFRGRGAAILMYHSVIEDPSAQDVFLGDISHARDIFYGQMELLARRYCPISLDQVRRFMCGEGTLPDRAVVVTFDDGYADNYEIAAPALNRVGVPATFYVTIGSVERRRLPWPARLRFLFRTTNRARWADSSGTSWPLFNAVEREKAYLLSCDECGKLVGKTQEKYVARLEGELDNQVPTESGALMMTYDQVRTLVQQGHIVGSHTMTHPNMAHVSLEDARHEMTESKHRLERELSAAVAHFSYPCPALWPHWTEQTVTASRDAGYETAVTTNGGLTRKGDNPLALKRISPTKTVEGLCWNLECAFAGRVV
jgi:peptidoglycan/xylan/chitin deacetylase (PgdA/CDA1 family)